MSEPTEFIPFQTDSWIRKIQERSWESELLVSGGAIFSLIQCYGWLVEMFTKMVEGGFAAMFFVLIPMIAVSGIASGFILNLILRGFWLAMVVLQRIYPEGIRTDVYKFAEPFQSKLKNNNQRQNIVKLDKVCSLVFIWSFTFTLLMFGIGGFATVMSSIVIITQDHPEFLETTVFRIVTIVYFIFAAGWIIFLYLDFFTGGLMRKNKTVARFYSPIYQFFNTATLGFLWRPILQTLLSNIKYRKSTVVAILIYYLGAFALSGLIFDSEALLDTFDGRKYKSAAFSAKENFYRDKTGDERWTKATIQSAVIQDNYLEVFYPYGWIADVTIDSLGTSVKSFDKILRISINDSVYAQPEWIGVEKINGQIGVTTILDITPLKNHLHFLTILEGKKITKIPFWKK